MNITINKVKIMVTVPTKNVQEVRDVLLESGAGVIGNYTHCSMATKCVGTFNPNELAHPVIGENNKMVLVEEEKLEVVCDVEKVKNVITRLRKIHPYEEPAIDIIPLLDEESFH